MIRRLSRVRMLCAVAAALLLLVPSALRAQGPDEDPGADPAATAQENEAAAEKDAKDVQEVRSRGGDEEVAGVASMPETAVTAPGVFSTAGDELRIAPGAPRARATRGWGPGFARFAGSLWLAVPACTVPAREATPPADDSAGGGAGRPACPPEMWTGAPAVTLRALDLVSAEWGHRVPRRSLRVAFGEPRRGIVTGAAPGTGAPLDWSAYVPLRGVRAGTYHGFLLFTRETDSTTVRPPAALPVTLQVRDSPLPALAILAAGFLLLMRLRGYRDGKLRRHTHLADIAEAKERIEADRHLAVRGGIAAPFRKRFAEHLRAAIARSAQPGAPEDLPELDAVDALLVKWSAGEPKWLAGLRADHAGIARLEPAARGAPHAKALLATLRDGYDGAPDVEAGGAGVDDVVPEGAELAPGSSSGGSAAAEYRREAEARAAMAERYFAFHAWLAEVRLEAQSGAKKDLLDAVDQARARWDALADPAGAAETEAALRQEVEAARAQAGLAPPPAAPDADESVSSGAESASLAPGEAEDDLVPVGFAARSAEARQARRRYATTLGVLVYFTTVLFGLRETWGDNPVFGANLLADYVEVIAWTLGANAVSLATAAAFAGQWSLPWLSRLVGGAPAAPGGAGGLGG